MVANACPLKGRLNGSDSTGVVLRYEDEKSGVKCCSRPDRQYTPVPSPAECKNPGKYPQIEYVDTYHHAEKICEDIGARLCTRSQLKTTKINDKSQNICCGLEEDYDSDGVWLADGMYVFQNQILDYTGKIITCIKYGYMCQMIF